MDWSGGKGLARFGREGLPHPASAKLWGFARVALSAVTMVQRASRWEGLSCYSLGAEFIQGIGGLPETPRRSPIARRNPGEVKH